MTHPRIAAFCFLAVGAGELTGYLFGAGTPAATWLYLESSWHTAFRGQADVRCSGKIKSLGKVQAPGPEQSS